MVSHKPTLTSLVLSLILLTVLSSCESDKANAINGVWLIHKGRQEAEYAVIQVPAMTVYTDSAGDESSCWYVSEYTLVQLDDRVYSYETRGGVTAKVYRQGDYLALAAGGNATTYPRANVDEQEIKDMKPVC